MKLAMEAAGRGSACLQDCTLVYICTPAKLTMEAAGRGSACLQDCTVVYMMQPRLCTWIIAQRVGAGVAVPRDLERRRVWTMQRQRRSASIKDFKVVRPALSEERVCGLVAMDTARQTSMEFRAIKVPKLAGASPRNLGRRRDWTMQRQHRSASIRGVQCTLWLCTGVARGEPCEFVTVAAGKETANYPAARG